MQTIKAPAAWVIYGMCSVCRQKKAVRRTEPQKSPFFHPFAIFHFNVEADVTAHATSFRRAPVICNHVEYHSERK